ncbi:methyltransferase [Bradyrhizobium jicamae]|uniref:Methyltransferase n=1 Tax=Bradyrhizobium jicamae TaxID=280332 RepID=A0ABS5FQI7_9BRAD|nr:methyltransferase [Bradyrhizobium jicamae]MBR0799069.1 methyltransferase [Bradyrhizobium jicamae]MBR0936877.1 methyltransferase [Bradyrhizobium jicamae]
MNQPNSATPDCAITPDAILQLGLGFWGSKALLSAVELRLFTLLADGPLSAETVTVRLALHPRSVRDFLDALVALGQLERKDGLYANTAAGALFLDRRKPTYVGGILEMANSRLYPFWGSLTEALRTGDPQNEAKDGRDLFDEIYREPAVLAEFLKAMSGISLGAANAISVKFPWAGYKSFADIGTAQGAVPVTLAQAHPHLVGIGFDLPVVQQHFESHVAKHELSKRLSFYAGDFFADPLPTADVLIMGHILHDWGLEKKRMLIRKAYAALPSGGALIVYDSVIDDKRRKNAFGLLMSLNMLIETREGFDYTGGDCMAWFKEAGFAETHVEPLVGPDSMVVGIK